MRKTYFAYSLLVLIFLGGFSSCKKEGSLFDIRPQHFLASGQYTKLQVEIVSVEGHEPHPTALNNLKDFLEARLNKPQGITFVQKTISSPNNYSFSAVDLRDLEKETRTSFAKKELLTAYIFYADQGYNEDTPSSTTLGVAYSSTSMCIFKDAIKDNSGGLGQVSEEILETAVLIHEFGHILGLVNNGTPMAQDHEDAQRPHHCDNENCLMYYASKSSDMLGFLGSGSIPQLDTQCLNDLKANGGK